jgi:hypothetical protein
MGLSGVSGKFWSLAAGIERERRMTRKNNEIPFLVTLDVNNATRYYT